MHCLAGENGCGKSTLIKVITGVYTPQSDAELYFDGKPIATMTPTLAQSLGIQVIWQDLALFDEMTVAENIGFQYAVNGKYGLVDKRAIEQAAEKALARLGVEIDLDRPLRNCPSPSVRSWRLPARWSGKRGSFSWTNRPRRSRSLKPTI